MWANAHKARAQSLVLPDFGNLLKFGLLAGDSIQSSDSVHVQGMAGSIFYLHTNIHATLPQGIGSASVVNALTELDSMRNYLISLPGDTLTGSLTGITLHSGIYTIAGNVQFSDTLWLSGDEHGYYIFNILGNAGFDSSFVLKYDTGALPYIIWNVRDTLNSAAELFGILTADDISSTQIGAYTTGLYSSGKIDLKGGGGMANWKTATFNPNVLCTNTPCGNLINNPQFDYDTTGFLGSKPFQMGYISCWQACTGTPHINVFPGVASMASHTTSGGAVRAETVTSEIVNTPVVAGSKYIMGYEYQARLRNNCNSPNFMDEFFVRLYSASGPLPSCNINTYNMPAIPAGMISTIADHFVIGGFTPGNSLAERITLFQAGGTPGTQYNRVWLYPRDISPTFISCIVNSDTINNQPFFNITNYRLYEITAGADVMLECGNSTLLGCANTDIQQAFPTAQFTWTLGGNVVGTGPTLNVSHSNNTAAPITLTYTLTVTVPGAAGLASLSDDVVVTMDPNPMSGTLTLSGLAPVCNPAATYTIDQYNPNSTYTITCDNGTVQNQNGANFNVVWNNLNGGTITIVEGNGPCPAVTQIVVQGCCLPPSFDAVTWNGNNDFVSQLAASLSITGSPLVFSGLTIVINGIFTIDNDAEFIGCEIVMGQNAEIVINNAVEVRFLHSYLHGCQDMWQGIHSDIQSSANLIIRNCLIEDALQAIDIEEDDLLMTSDCIFNKNLNGIRVTNTTANPNIVSNNLIHNTAFCSNNLNFPSVLPLPMFNGIAIKNFINTNPLNLNVPMNLQNFGNEGIRIDNFANWDFPDLAHLQSTTVMEAENYFTNLITMLICRNSGLTARRNFFEQSPFVGTITAHIGLSNSTNDVGIYAINAFQGQPTRNITIGDPIIPDMGNTFQNCRVAVSNIGNFNSLCVGNIFNSNAIHGLFKNNNLLQNTINFDYNKCNVSFFAGVYGFNNLFSRNIIQGNTFHNVQRFGILWDNPGVTAPGIQGVWTQILENVIDGNGLSAGIRAINIDRFSALNNAIEFTAPFNAIANGAQRFGINVSGSPQNYLADNTIDRNTTTQFGLVNFSRLVGISNSSSNSPIVCQNQLNNMGIGLQFEFGCNNSRINLNNMFQNFLGVNLNQANIASGLTTGDPGDNIWISNYGPLRISGSIAVADHFWLFNNSDPDMNPNNYSVTGIGVFFQDLPISPLQFPYTANCGNMSVRSDFDQEQINLYSLLNIVNATYNIESNDTLAAYKLAEDLYFLSEVNRFDSLITAMAQVDSDYAIINNYRNSISQGFTGKIFSSMKFELQGDYIMAQSFLNQAECNYTFEFALKELLQLKINILSRDSLYLTDSEAETIVGFANLEGSLYSKAADIAKALLALLPDNEPKSTQKSPPATNISSNTIQIYPCPNPNNGILKFCSNDKSVLNIDVEIFNSLGILISRKNNVICNETLIELISLPSGIYFYKIEFEEKMFKKGSFIIH